MSKIFQLTLEQSKIVSELQHEQSHILHIEDMSFIVCKWLNIYHVYTNTCPHNRKQLATQDSSLMDESGALLVCEHHGATFLPQSGLCVSGPCTGEYLNKVALVQRGMCYQIEYPLS